MADPAEGVRRLRGITWDHPRGYDPVVAASAAYKDLCGISIEWDKRSLQAFADAPIDKLAEQYDLIVLDHPHVGKIAETGALRPLARAIRPEESLGGSAESYVWKGQLWAHALDAACQMSAFRPDLNPMLPTHWEDFLGDDGAASRPLTPLLPVDAFDMLMTIVAGRGGAAMPADTETFVSMDNGVFALEVMRRLYTLGPAEQVRMNPIHVLETLSETDDFASSPCLFGYVNYARPGFRTHQIAYFDMPLCQGYQRPRAILGGAGIGVSARSENGDAAEAFAEWITSPEIQSGVFLDNNGQPANRLTWCAQQGNGDVAGFFSGGFHTIDNAWTRPRAPWFLDYVDEVCAIMPDFFVQAIPAETFCARLNAIYRDHGQKG